MFMLQNGIVNNSCKLNNPLFFINSNHYEWHCKCECN